MNNETLIEVSNVSKCYKIADTTIAKVINAFIPAYQRGVKDFWALKNINLTIKRGEAVAIIGRNGSGKSTLLEIITGTRKPTSGIVRVKGRVAALLQLGSGFNPEFSGRENVILNGLLLGLSRSEVESKFDEIITFADIGDVIDQPVKNYSSGMLVRLAFSVQVALEPDILIIDEALSVGDFFFKQKCATRMRELREAGTTILFVSHSMGSVREICDRAIVLRQGELIFTGDSNQAIRHYLSHGKSNESKVFSSKQVSTNKQVSSNKLTQQWADIVTSEDGMLWQHESIENTLVTGGLLAATIIYDEYDEPLVALIGQKRTFRLYFKAIDNHSVIIEFLIKDRHGKLVYGTSSIGQSYGPFTSKEPSILCFDLSITLLLGQGGYSFQYVCREQNEVDGVEQYESLMKTPELGPFQIKRDQEAPLLFKGQVGLPVESNLEVIN